MSNIDTLPPGLLEEIRQQVRREIQSGRPGGGIPGRTITEKAISAYAHCATIVGGVQCEGHAQVEVRAICQIEEHTVASRGGAAGGNGAADLTATILVENSWERLRFEAEADAACPYCGRVRELSRQVRPTLEEGVGGQDALLRARQLGRLGFDPTKQERIERGERESPRELLDRRYIDGTIELSEYEAKRAVLEGGSRPSVQAEDPEQIEDPLPAGVRRKNGGYQAYWREDGQQRSSQHATVDEAVAARAAAVSED